MTRFQTPINTSKSYSPLSILLLAFVISFFTIFTSLRGKKSDTSKISVRPRVFIEGAAPVPILDEYDFTSPIRHIC